MDSKHGKPVALVTGGSRGIGRACAIRLAADGFAVVVNYVAREDAAREVVETIEAAGGTAFPLQFDIADREAVESSIARVFAEAGPVRVLVNNAATLKDQLFLRMTDDDWHRVLDVNLHGTFYCTRAVIKGMAGKREAGRRIINITSIAGETGNVGQSNYAASKAALIGLTKSLARELVSMKVTVNAVAPGFIATEFVASLPTEQLEKKIPMRRLGEPDEVAAVVSLLASEEGEYITGEVVRINGGLLM